MRFASTMIAVAVAMVPAAAQGRQGRELCADRSGLGTPPCTVEPGRVVAELGLADWTRDSDATQRTESLEAADLLVRIGLNERTEAQIGWTAFGLQRQRDRLTGDVARTRGAGDLFVAVRANLANPDGSGASIAVMPYATLPTGGEAIGAGDWSAGLLLPMSFDLGGVTFELVPRGEAAVDADRVGRHLRYGAVTGLSLDLTDQLTAVGELSLHRDDDPSGATSEALTGFSLAWRSNADTQWDAGINLGLDRTSPDVELFAGIVRRF